jgi:hypothetical protein
MCNPAVSDTGEQETRGAAHGYLDRRDDFHTRGLLFEPEQIFHPTAERFGQTQSH